MKNIGRRTRRALSTAVSGALLLVLGTPSPALAAAGELDTTFGDNGSAEIDFSNGADLANAIVVDGDDRVVIVGSSLDLDSSIRSAVMTRLNADGELDTSFGDEGRVVFHLSSTEDNFHAVSLAPDGRIVVGGSTRNGSRGNDILLARFESDGSLDASFGGTGSSVIDLGSSDTASVVAVQNDGSVVFGGRSALLRQAADGSRDLTFGTNGIADTTPLSTNALVVEPNGRILVGGTVAGSPHQQGVGRLEATGVFDTSYGTNGIATAAFAQPTSGTALALQPDGKTVVAGTRNTNPYNFDFAVTRFTETGALDPGFGLNGMTSADFSVGDFPRGVAVQADGAIVVAGSVVPLRTTAADIGVARFLGDGSPDPTFGTSGKALTNLGKFEFHDFLALQSSGGIITAGHASSSVGRQDANFSVARFQHSNDSTPPVVIGVPDRSSNPAGWYNEAVLIDWMATDSSGFATDPPNTFASIEGADVTYESDESCDRSGNCAAGSLRLSIDTAGPVVTCASASFILNEPGGIVTASVADDLSGVLTSAIEAAVDTSIPGTSHVTLTGTDIAGNTTRAMCPVSVDYQFQGFEPPIENYPEVNESQAGRTIPIAWTITDFDGVPVDDPGSFAGMTSRGPNCDESDQEIPATASGSSGLRYLGDGTWTYNWKTSKAFAGECHLLQLMLADGVDTRIALFEFR